MIPQEVWAELAPVLKPALADGWTLERVRAELDARRAWLWRNGNSAMVSEIADHRDFHIWLAGGDRGDLLELQDSAEQHAKAQGCTRMTIIGRKGWDRVMAQYGYRPMLVKEL